jgi:hypothetical protein
MLLALLTFCNFFLAFLNGLKYGSHVCQPFLAPILFVGLMFVGQLSSKLFEGLTIIVPMATVSRVMSLMGPTVSLAFLAKLLDSCLFQDSIK